MQHVDAWCGVRVRTAVAAGGEGEGTTTAGAPHTQCTHHTTHWVHRRFDHLGIAVQPRKGQALLFFPSFANVRER